MELYSVARALHFFGAVLWIGGTVAAASVAAIYAGPAKKDVALASRAVATRLGTSAMLAAWAGGLGMLIPQWGSVYSHAPWMHAKLTLVFIAAGLSGAVSGILRRGATDGELPAGKLRGMSLALVVIALTAVCLAVFKPGR